MYKKFQLLAFVNIYFSVPALEVIPFSCVLVHRTVTYVTRPIYREYYF